MKTKTGRAAPNVHAHSLHADLVFSSIMSILVSKQYDKSFPTPARPTSLPNFQVKFPLQDFFIFGMQTYRADYPLEQT